MGSPCTSQLHSRRKAYSTAATAEGEGSMGYPFTACKACMLNALRKELFAAMIQLCMLSMRCVLLASLQHPKHADPSACMIISRGLIALRQRHRLSKRAHPEGVAILIGAAAHNAAILEQVINDGGAVGCHLGSCLLSDCHLPLTVMYRGRQGQSKYLPAHSNRRQEATQRRTLPLLSES